MLRMTILLAALHGITGCSQKIYDPLKDNGLTTLSQKTLPGGWVEVKVNDEIQHLARFAVRDHPKDAVDKIHSAKAQQVIGMCYLLSFQMKSGKKWQAELYKDIKGNVTLLEILPLKNKVK